MRRRRVLFVFPVVVSPCTLVMTSKNTKVKIVCSGDSVGDVDSPIRLCNEPLLAAVPFLILNKTPVSGNCSSAITSPENDNNIEGNKRRRVLFDCCVGGGLVDVDLSSSRIPNNVKDGRFWDEKEKFQESLFAEGYDSNGGEPPLLEKNSGRDW